MWRPTDVKRLLHSGAVLAAIGLGLLTGGCTLSSWGTPAATLTPTARPPVYRDREFGWTVIRPAHLQSGHFTANGMFTADGEWFANFDMGINGNQTASRTVPDFRRLRNFPATGAALMIWFGERLAGPPPLRDSRFPVTVASLAPIQPYAGGAEPTPLYRQVHGDGSSFAVAVWLGPHAAPAAKQEVAATLASLRFPPLRTGTERAGRFDVLGRTTAYPVGSVTHFASSSLPIAGGSGLFLIHAPRAFYAIPDTFQAPNSHTTCALTYDSASKHFRCPATGMQWNLVGIPNPVSNAGYTDGMDIGLHIATVAQDGHVLYAPSFGALFPLLFKGNPWA